MKKLLFALCFMVFVESKAQTIKPIPKEKHIESPELREFYKAQNDGRLPNLKYLKPEDLIAKKDTTRVVYAELDRMPILNVKGSMPNSYRGSKIYRMPNLMEDDKKKNKAN